jgi:AcrR family transcriptional regulator
MSTMGAGKRGVKPGRRYDSSGRLQAAQRTRARVLEVARERFLANGYAATTVAAISTAAGVSVETIYKSYGGKAGLVRTLRDAALQGQGPVPAEQRSDQQAAVATDPREIVRGWGRLTSEVMPRVAPILLLVRAAAGADDEMAVVRRETEDGRLERMAYNAGYLLDGGHVRDGLDLARVRDILFAFSSPELYELLVLRQGWSTDDYSRFVADGIAAAVLPPAAGRGWG